MKLEELREYEVLERRMVEDLHSEGWVLRHRKTGARVVLLSNDDENKVFYVGFRTPPEDSTGVAHIIEHTVLCGSEAFPVKDPFIELVKGSLNTFLNAMTYPDKTVYPVASCNDKDFQNLMHVYLDAVFYPNIYKEENIFRQEGWHYELESQEGELGINGVVYNEMKGAFSSPDDVLERLILNSLYPDNTYALESGGNPEEIPELTYGEFLDFHRKYYHPSNSYIYLYGNMDMAEKLAFIDREYLSRFDALEVDSEIRPQKAFERPVRIEGKYSITEGESERENTYLSYNTSVGSCLDRKLYVAFQVLDYALCSAPGAPLKKALIDEGIGKDVYSFYDNGVRQPYFSVVAKNTDLEREEDFIRTIEGTLERLCEQGIDKRALRAGLNHFEFKYREADYGSNPKGLMLGLQILDSWLYDDGAPFIHVEALETFAQLKKDVEGRYFEELVRTYLLDNPHRSIVAVEPKKGLTAEKDEALSARLRAYKDSLSAEEISRIVEETEALERYQEEPDSREDLERIPVLSKEDMRRKAEPYHNQERREEGVFCLFHDIYTNGIGYLRFIFDLGEVPEELFPYVGLLKQVIGLMDTENYTYGDLFNEINIRTGGLDVVANTYTHADQPGTYDTKLEIKVKTLYENMPWAFRLVREILTTTKYEDTGRLFELVEELKSKMQAAMISSGHSVAAIRALSYFSETAAVSGLFGGIPFYRLLERLEEDFEEEKDKVAVRLRELGTYIFRPENFMLDITAAEEGYELAKKELSGFRDSLYTGKISKTEYRPPLSKKNEGFVTSSQVQYVCRAGNFRKRGLPYTGALKVLKVMMGYDYLWTQIRVKGGAYGCMCSFGRNGDSYFVSYRDPNLESTVEVFEKAADYIKEYEADERTVTQYIIGAVSDLDTPMTPAMKGVYSLTGYLTHYTYEQVQEERDQVLSVTEETIRGLSEYIRAFMEEDCLCVVGNEERIKEDRGLFLSVEQLFH